ncbi:MAG: hypothetical protein ABI178_06035 [Rhodanobacter sp.]
MPNSPRMALAATLFAGVLLAGCAQQPATRPASAPAPVTGQKSSTQKSTPQQAPTASSAGSTSDENASDRTGIAACDDYLSSYLACHRAAQIFAPDQLQSRYEAMRNSLLRDSKNPDIRPQLAERCNSLARSLRQALHGKSCEASPAPAASSP